MFSSHASSALSTASFTVVSRAAGLSNPRSGGSCENSLTEISRCPRSVAVSRTIFGCLPRRSRGSVEPDFRFSGGVGGFSPDPFHLCVRHGPIR
jgi:hypothetical protein